jgi:uncharacterized membrane protein
MADQLENIVVATFPDASKAYQALSVLTKADEAGRVGIIQIAVVERTPDGKLQVPEGSDHLEGINFAANSLVGMMVGVLGGPVGLLLGWGTGALIGGIFDLKRESSSETALAEIGRSIAPGSTALIADVREVAVEVLDGEINKLGGHLTRRPTSEVLAEVEAAEDAARAAAEEAERVMRAQRC